MPDASRGMMVTEVPSAATECTAPTRCLASPSTTLTTSPVEKICGHGSCKLAVQLQFAVDASKVGVKK